MPEIQVILRKDDGTAYETTFVLEGSLDTLGSIDAAVELFKNQTLPQIEQELLQTAQQCQFSEKKTN
jgi:hypothetical protein